MKKFLLIFTVFFFYTLNTYSAQPQGYSYKFPSSESGSDSDHHNRQEKHWEEHITRFKIWKSTLKEIDYESQCQKRLHELCPENLTSSESEVEV